jgi:hypothetical protein
MSLNKDIFLRSHVVEIDPKDRLVSDYDEPKWPEYALVFDTETTLDRRNSHSYSVSIESADYRTMLINAWKKGFFSLTI